MALIDWSCYLFLFHRYTSMDMRGILKFKVITVHSLSHADLYEAREITPALCIRSTNTTAKVHLTMSLDSWLVSMW